MASPVHKSKHQLTLERDQFKKEVGKLLEKYDADHSKSLVNEVRALLQDLDHSPPLDKDVKWVMTMGDKDDSGTIQTAELHVVLLKYKKYRHDNPGLVKLIQKWDKNKDGDLSNVEMKGLLNDVHDTEISDEDVTFVMGKYEEFKGGSKDMDADALAKAISTWEDQKMDEMNLFGIKMPSFKAPDLASSIPNMDSLPKMDPPDFSKAGNAVADMGKNFTSIFSCCSMVEETNGQDATDQAKPKLPNGQQV